MKCFVKKCCSLGLVFFMLSCTSEQEATNIVATVNGKPITLHTLQALQEADIGEFSSFTQPSLATLSKQYGAALTSLIVYEIMTQELEKRDIAITNAAVEALEARIRKDYPAGEFEKHFTENAIDITAWRELLRYQLGLQLFADEVLRKNYVLSEDDAMAFYENNKSQFALPEMLSLYVAQTNDASLLKNITSADELKNIQDIIEFEQMTVQRDAVPESWRKKVFALKEQACTQITDKEKNTTIVCLENREAGQELNIAQAYPYMEEIFVNAMLNELLVAWLEKKIPQVEIFVSKHLMEEFREDE